jgi:uncharacterized protein (DUF1330 family)
MKEACLAGGHSYRSGSTRSGCARQGEAPPQLWRGCGEDPDAGPEPSYRYCDSRLGQPLPELKRGIVHELKSQTGGNAMYKSAMVLLAGVAIGAIAVQGLYAQGAKLRAYSISEADILDASFQATYLPAARKAIEAAHGRALRTAAGRVVQVEGGPAPKSVGIVEWDSLDEAVAFYKSKAWTDLAPQRDKAAKVIRRYVVEVEK